MKLYLGNLPFKATEADISAWFQQQGFAVDSVTVMRDRFSNEPRGFGFAEIHDDAAQRAVEVCHGQQMGGRALVINEARPMSKGGGGGRGGDRGDRGPRPPRREHS
jgi:RNA recognition motif-containing protein